MRIITTCLLITAVAVQADITHCPKYCSCTGEATSTTSSINVVCTRLSPEELEFSDTVQHLTVTPENNETAVALTDYLFQKLGLSELESLKIANTSLTDISEKTFFGLYSLYDLNLSNNQLYLIHPETFADNRNLRNLNLSGNPVQLMQMLQASQSYLLRSSTLKQLDLSNCQLSKISPKTFTELRNLFFVNLSLNYLKSIPKDLFENLQYLEKLDLSSNSIAKLDNDTFNRNTALSSLKLRKNPIESLKGLNVTSLDELDMSYCEISILMKKTLEGVSHLTVLNLSNNQIAVISSDAFSALRELKKLDLSCNKLTMPLTDDLFENINNLEVLSLSGNKKLGDFIGDTGFLQHHPAMQKLELADCGLTKLTAGQLKGMDNLNELNVRNNAIRELDDLTFRNLKRLNTLDLSNNRLLSLGVLLFVGNLELVTLQVNGNPLKYLTHYTFSHTPVLKSLFVSNCELERLWESHKYDDNTNKVLTKLIHLDISKNKLRDLRKRDFAHMEQLEVADMRGNPLECSTNIVETINFLNSEGIDLYRSSEDFITREEPGKSRWNELLENICGAHKSLEDQPQNTFRKTSSKNNFIPARILENTQTSYTKVDEIVIETNSTVPMWPMLLAVSIFVVALYFIIYLVGEITPHRRGAAAAPCTRPGLGGHVRSRDESGSPFYYKLYEECSIPVQSSKKKSYILNFSPMCRIMKKNTTYKIVKNNEAIV